jgi:hypothetical protein
MVTQPTRVGSRVVVGGTRQRAQVSTVVVALQGQLAGQPTSGDVQRRPAHRDVFAQVVHLELDRSDGGTARTEDRRGDRAVPPDQLAP